MLKRVESAVRTLKAIVDTQRSIVGTFLKKPLPGDSGTIRQGNYTAYGVDPLIDARRYNNDIRLDDDVYMSLYGLHLANVDRYRELSLVFVSFRSV